MKLNLSYQTVSPITKERTVMCELDDEGVLNQWCLKSGYMTKDTYIDGSDLVRAFEEVSPDVISETRVLDDVKQVWYRTFLAQGDCVLYPDYYDGDPIWKVGKYVKDEVSDVPPYFCQYRKLSDDVTVRYAIDDANSSIFEDEQFPEALDALYKLINAEDDND